MENQFKSGREWDDNGRVDGVDGIDGDGDSEK